MFKALYKIILKQIHDSGSGVDYRMDNLIQELTRKRNDINDTKKIGMTEQFFTPLSKKAST